MVGQTISHYKILAKLGEGGMGVVNKAEDTKLRRTVALKFPPVDKFASEEEKARFVREAQAAAALNHPNICTVHEIDEADGHTFIAMAEPLGALLSLAAIIFPHSRPEKTSPAQHLGGQAYILLSGWPVLRSSYAYKGEEETERSNAKETFWGRVAVPLTFPVFV